MCSGCGYRMFVEQGRGRRERCGFVGVPGAGVSSNAADGWRGLPSLGELPLLQNRRHDGAQVRVRVGRQRPERRAQVAAAIQQLVRQCSLPRYDRRRSVQQGRAGVQRARRQMSSAPGALRKRQVASAHGRLRPVRFRGRRRRGLDEQLLGRRQRRPKQRPRLLLAAVLVASVRACASCLCPCWLAAPRSSPSR